MLVNTILDTIFIWTIYLLNVFDCHLCVIFWLEFENDLVQKFDTSVCDCNIWIFLAGWHYSMKYVQNTYTRIVLLTAQNLSSGGIHNFVQANPVPNPDNFPNKQNAKSKESRFVVFIEWDRDFVHESSFLLYTRICQRIGSLPLLPFPIQIRTKNELTDSHYITIYWILDIILSFSLSGITLFCKTNISLISLAFFLLLVFSISFRLVSSCSTLWFFSILICADTHSVEILGISVYDNLLRTWSPLQRWTCFLFGCFLGGHFSYILV